MFVSILSYCAGIWRVSAEELRNVMNALICASEGFFNYCKYEFVRQVLLGFRILSFDLFVLRAIIG